MNHSFVEENWQPSSRKFPLVGILAISPSDDIKELAKSYCEQLDHVLMFLDASCKIQDFQSFLSRERIINLSVTLRPQIPNIPIENLGQFITQDNLHLIIVKKNDPLKKSARWLFYDRIKEMKTPWGDVQKLDSDLNFCLNNESFCVSFKHNKK